MTDSGTSPERKTVSEIFREHGYPPMTDERRAAVEATRLAGLDDLGDCTPEEAVEAVKAVRAEPSDH